MKILRDLSSLLDDFLDVRLGVEVFCIQCSHILKKLDEFEVKGVQEADCCKVGKRSLQVLLAMKRRK